MKKQLFPTLVLSVMGAGGVCSQVLAETDEFTVDAELAAGVEYDSRLSVDELDRSAAISDEALVTSAKISGKWKPTSPFSLKGGYSYSGTKYRDNSEFDIDIHQLYADASYDFDVATVGASQFFADAKLDGEGLLELSRTSLYVSKLMDKRFFVRLAMDLTDKDFDTRSQRDADSSALSGDVYYFFNQAKSFVSVGVSGEEEDAVGDEFDFDGVGFKAKVSNKFQIAGKDSKLSLEYRYKQRDYDNLTPLIGERRDETRQNTKLVWEVWFTEQVGVENSLEYGNYNSNLDSNNFSEVIGSVVFKWKI